MIPKPAKREKRARKPIARSSTPIKRGKLRVFRDGRITKKALESIRKKLIKKADNLCRAIVRARGACEACGSTDILQWAHGYGRRYLRTRWSTWFTFCLCRDCHCNFTKHWEQWVAWMMNKLGYDLFHRMQTEALRTDPITNEEIEAIIAQLEHCSDPPRPAIIDTTNA